MANNPLTKILVIDDDRDSLTIAKYSLEGLKGVTIHTADSGEAGIQEALTFKPDLILLDYRMPKMDGMATLKAIRNLPQIASIPVVFFTASVQRDEIDTFTGAGAIDIITKPFDAISLPPLVLKIWEAHKGS